ncbi:MAG: hypothetical protein ABI432_17895 [Flavobacteriales bacterium]
MPLTRPQRIAFRLCLAAAATFALFVAVGFIAEHQVRVRLDDAAAQVCARVDDANPPEVTVTLLDRSVRITGLTLEPLASCSDHPMAVRGHLDTLQVSGVSLMGLLFSGSFAAQNLVIQVKDGSIAMRSDTASIKPANEMKPPGDAWSIDLESFHVQLRSITVLTGAGDTINARDEGVGAGGRDLHFLTGQENALASLRVQKLLLSVDSLDASMASGYLWSIGRCAVDEEKGTIDVHGVRLDPEKDLEQLSTTLQFETDVFQVRLDTVQVAGADVNKMLAQGVLSARAVNLAGGDVTVLRDKTLPDGPSVVMPLLARVIRQLPSGSGVDTISVDGLNARYRERGDPRRGYALIPFTDISATITGVRPDAADTNALVVRARCIAFDTTPVSLKLRSVIADTTDHFELDASIGSMSFTALNKATGPLADIQATAGRMDSVIFRMSAGDRHAQGVVHMAYRGLKVTSGGRKSDETMNRIETLLINSLVRDRSRDRDGTPRQGVFSFDRRRDRAIFNYMWSGLREGTKAMLMPDGLVK